MRVTVITITYNSEAFLETTVKSVLAQEFRDFEYLIVDGGSTDRTLDIVREYARKDDRIKWVSEPDGGIADAMNKGIVRAGGEIVAHLHSDDYYPNAGVLSAVVAALQDSTGQWATGGMFVVDDRGNTLDRIEVRDYAYSKLLDGNTLLHPSTFVKKAAFDKVGLFDTSLKYAMDYDMWLRLGAACGAPVSIDQALSCFRVHTQSISSVEADNAATEEWLIRKKHLGMNVFKLLYHYYMFRKTKSQNSRYFDRLMAGQDNEWKNHGK